MRFGNVRLRHRIFLYYSLLIILSTILFGYYAYQANAQTAQENFTSAVTGSMAQTVGSVSHLLGEAEKQANLFAGSYTVQGALAGGDVPVVQQYDHYLDLERAINAYEKNFDSFSIRLFLNTPRRFLNDGVRYFSASALNGGGGEPVLLQRNAVLYWQKATAWEGDGAGALLSCYRQIVSANDISISMGTVAFDVKTSAVSAILQNASLPENHRLYLLDESGNRLYDANGTKTGSSSADKETMRKIREMGFGSLRIDTREGPELLVFRELSGFPLYLAVDIPISELSNRSKLIMYNFVWVALLVLAVSFIGAYFISGGVTRRLIRLIKAMGTVENHEFNISVPDDSRDELGILNRRFNWMMERIRTLINDVYKSNYEKKEAELKLLQAQINPHFLYNALDSVHWLAVKHRAPDIGYMVRNLSDFLRLSLHVDGSSTVGTELKHTRAYFNIQKYRFEDRIELRDEVPQELYGIEVIPLLLQPLVENAILHGILPFEDRKGLIVIRGSLAEGTVTLEVSDDGAGIAPERLAQLTEALDAERAGTAGTGLRNVRRRIRFRYGEPYGLAVTSAPGQGTSCVLTFPANI